jgi:hypothetical protein
VKAPIEYAHQNLLIGSNNYAGLYRLNTVSYPFLSSSDKRTWLSRLARFAFSVGADFSLYRVTRAYPASSYPAQAMAMLDARHQDPENWRALLETHKNHLEGLQSFLPEIYLAITLPGEFTKKTTTTGLINQGRRLVENALGVASPMPILASQLETLVDEEDRAFHRASAILPMERATVRELQWLFRRAECRGLEEPGLEEFWKPNALIVDTPEGGMGYQPLKHTIERLMNGSIEEDSNGLVVESEAGKSYQAMLGLGALPEESLFPGGAELLFTPLEGVDFPVDVVMHCRWIGNADARSKVKRRIIDADVAFGEQMTSEYGPMSLSVEENRLLARELNAYLESNERPPLLDMSISLACWATTPGERSKRVETLRHRYGRVELHLPRKLQESLYYDFLPRADVGRVRTYADILTVEQFAALMPIGTHEAGSARGAYIGRTVTGGRRPIKFDITEASRTGRPPSILAAGSLGSGKTIFAELLAIQAERRGSIIVDFDPKPDHNLENVPELAKRGVQVIELAGKEEYRGLLDPLTVAPDGLREDLAASYLIELLPASPPVWETQIRKAVKEVLTQPEPGCLKVIEHLLNTKSSDAQAAGEALEVWSDTGLARLGFGNGVLIQDHVRKPVTTIKAPGLSLPAPGVLVPSSPSERIGLATLKLIAAFTMRLVQGDRSVHKVVLFDEAWFLLASSDGRNLIDRLNRMGRSENATLILATQGLVEVGDIENLIGTRFIFGQETVTNAKRGLEILGMDHEDRGLIERVRGYRRGRCLMRDIHGRVAELQIDPVSHELLEILDTNPKAAVAA